MSLIANIKLSQFSWIVFATLFMLIFKEVWQTSLPILAVSVMNVEPSVLGLLLATENLPLLLLGLFVGAWIDRIGPARALGWALGGQLAILVVVLILCIGHDFTGTIGALFPFVFMVGLASMMFDVSLLAITPNLVRSNRLPWANKILTICQSFAEIGGPLVAGVLIAATGSLGVLTALCVLVGLALIFWSCAERLAVPPSPSEHKSSTMPSSKKSQALRSSKRNFLLGFRMLVDSALMRAIVFNSLAWNLFYGMLLPIFVSRMAMTWPQREWMVSLAFSANGAGFLCGGLASGWFINRLGLARSILAAKLIGAVASLALILAYVGELQVIIVVSIVAFFVFGIVVAISQISSVSLRQRAVPQNLLGRVMAAFRIVSWTGLPVGSVIGGYAAQHLGTLHALGLVVGMNIIFTALLFCTPLIRRDVSIEADTKAATGGPQEIARQ